MLRRSRELFADILRQTDLVLLALCALCFAGYLNLVIYLLNG